MPSGRPRQIHPGVVGRPTVLTAGRARTALAALRDGCTHRCVAGLIGVGPDVFEQWLSSGRAGNPTFAPFARQVALAEAQVELEQTRKWSSATPRTEWKAAQAWLGRRRSRTWGPLAQRVDLQVHGGMDLSVLDPGELEAVLAALSRAKKSSGENA